MTETPRPPGLTPERLEEMKRHFDRTLGLGISELRQLFQHIDALSAALQAARAERDELKNLLQGASGQLKVLDRHQPHEAVTELLTDIARALEPSR